MHLLGPVILLATAVAAVVALAVGQRSPHAAAQIGATLAGVGAAVAGIAVLMRVTASAALGTIDAPLLSANLDTLALVMATLILSLSAVIQSFAVRYLRGDSRQLWFVVWANLVTASSVAMVCAATVLGFAIAWIVAGVSLVALLRTYPKLTQARDGVRRTAIRFAIGDMALALAVGTLLFSAHGDVPFANAARLPAVAGAAVALLLVVAALARSSQLPFHGWLPATLAAPTPVSALMHAGVVNAGAILIIRFSPVIGQHRLAMALVFLAGATTLVFASAVRLVKSDVKGRLVFSTIAQMGFMMLACGMGAYGAAVFHLIAHGLFKSTLFLGAGTGVAREASRRAWPVREIPRWPQRIVAILLATAVPIAAIAAARFVTGVHLDTASSALQLFVVFTAAVAFGAMLWARLSVGAVLLGTTAMALLAIGYTIAVAAFDTALHLKAPPAAVSPWWLVTPAAALLVLWLFSRVRWRGRLVRWAYVRALSMGTPLTPTCPVPDPSVKEHV